MKFVLCKAPSLLFPEIEKKEKKKRGDKERKKNLKIKVGYTYLYNIFTSGTVQYSTVQYVHEVRHNKVHCDVMRDC